MALGGVECWHSASAALGFAFFAGCDASLTEIAASGRRTPAAPPVLGAAVEGAAAEGVAFDGAPVRPAASIAINAGSLLRIGGGGT